MLAMLSRARKPERAEELSRMLEELCLIQLGIPICSMYLHLPALFGTWVSRVSKELGLKRSLIYGNGPFRMVEGNKIVGERGRFRDGGDLKILIRVMLLILEGFFEREQSISGRW